MSVTPRTGAENMASTPHKSPTAATALFGDADPARALAAAPGWSQVLGRLGHVLGVVSAPQRDLAARQLSGAATGLLGVRLGDVLVAAWGAHQALMTAARATLETPGATELVQLSTHRITTAHHPYVDITVNDMKIATIHFDLSLALEVDALLGTVTRGRLVGLASGRCTASANFGCEGVDLVSRQSEFDPAFAVDIGDGIPLVRGSSD